MSEYTGSYTVEMLKELMEKGKFHHATYRDIGTIWEGWYIYEKDESGMRGFTLVGAFGKRCPRLKEVEELVRNTGYSVGSYGNG